MSKLATRTASRINSRVVPDDASDGGNVTGNQEGLKECIRNGKSSRLPHSPTWGAIPANQARDTVIVRLPQMVWIIPLDAKDQCRPGLARRFAREKGTPNNPATLD